MTTMSSQFVGFCLALLVSYLSSHTIEAFVPASPISTRTQCDRQALSPTLDVASNQDDTCNNQNLIEKSTVKDNVESLKGSSVIYRSRRDWMLQSTRTFLGAAGVWMFGTSFVPKLALADSATATENDKVLPSPAVAPLQVEMKTFIDPMGLFVIQIPKRFFALRRSSQGDLPDAKGQGRRGSSIFTAGDLAKAEVIAIERFPIKGLLEENGIVVGAGSDDLTTFTAIGKPSAVANLLNQHRERSRPGQSMAVLVPDSWTLSPDGKELEFMVKAEIDVQKPELLLEQSGISRLFRVTLAKASLESNDGNVTAVFCSALEQDYQGPDGEALRAAAKSFRALDTASASTA